MASEVTDDRLDRTLESLLARLRRLIRGYVWLEGLAMVAAWLALAFWTSLALDWMFEPPAAVRKLILTAALVGGGYVLYRYILMRAFRPLGDGNLALLLERRFRQFRESLLTSVELAAQPVHAAMFNNEMLAHTRAEALARARQVNPTEVLRWSPLARKGALAAGLVVSIVAFGVLAPHVMATWYQRNIQFEDVLWPRRTHLMLEGFDNGRIKVAKGSDLEIVVNSETNWNDPDRVVPEIVQVRYFTADGTRGRENMSRSGVASVPRDRFQKFTYKFQSILNPLTFDIIGGDDRLRDLQIDVVDNPVITDMVLACEFPSYTHRDPREIRVTGLMRLPQGTGLTIKAQANKELVEVAIHRVGGEKLEPLATLQVNGLRNFEYKLDSLNDDQTLLFVLHDADGIRSREPPRLSLAALPDDPPQVDLRLRSIGTAITANARLPVEGEIRDTYGVAKAWFEHQADDAAPVEQPFRRQPKGAEKLEILSASDESLDIRDFGLNVGQKLLVAMKAADTYDLGDQPNVGTSQRYLLDVVTPEQLRSLLDARELALRRRFETIIQEMTETRDSLVDVQFGGTPAAEKPSKAEESEELPALKPGAEPGEREPQRRASSSRDRSIRVQRALQNSQRSAYEVLELANAFDEIREQFVNNRVDTEEVLSRLEQGIAVPLRGIGLKMFPELQQRLKLLNQVIENPETGPLRLDEARQQADAILVEMNTVLKRMLELETFNELVEILRSLIDSQTKVNQQTLEQHKQKARSLLEEE